jgi:drug/metabolite transporter (DMT)-like permease
MACLSAMNVIIQLMSPALHSTQMVLLRNLWSVVIVVAWSAWLSRGRPKFVTQRIKSHFWRATVGIAAMQLWFYSVTIMPLNIATALSFTTPIFSAILAFVFLGEQAGIRRWSAIITGFIGMLIILRPDIGIVHPAAGIVLAASVLMAFSGVLVKSLTRTESPETIVFYMSVFMALWSVAPAIINWQDLGLRELGLCFVVALFSTAAHLMIARAYVTTDMVALMPFDFTRLVFTAILAYLVFNETLDLFTIIGAALIVASTVYIARREAILRRQLLDQTLEQ